MRGFEMDASLSAKLYLEAQRYLPGGVDSPVRAFGAVGGQPLFIKRAHGSRICDEDGNEFIDYVCSWGAGVLGHAHPDVAAAVKKAVDDGTSFGAPTAKETVLAKLVASAVPSIERVRFVNSGTEATMSALRLARAFTGRDRILKFAGGYHGHSDGLLVKAGSGAATLGLADSPGVPAGYTQNTLVAPYNDLAAVDRVFADRGDEIAAIIVEPIAANMGVVPPVSGFLEGLRSITADAGAVLIFDEVITGFRVAYGGAQELYGVTPDLTCLGKIIGGGLPVGAYGGSGEIMDMVAPVGPVYQAGTLSGNPLAMAAGIETLRILGHGRLYDRLEQIGAGLETGLREVASRCEVGVQIQRVGSMLTAFFTDCEVTDYLAVRASDTGTYARFFHDMLGRGVYLAPSQFEAAFVSLAHSDDDISFTVEAAAEAFGTLSGAR
jgi:glutamate-1-semialdehyde 2,1-aminomutase